MTAQEIVVAAMALMAKIEAITGWAIPDAPKDDILIDQLALKLTESYPTVNPEEIEFAMRQYGTTVKDWGKAMNLSLIDEVMLPYLEKRKELSRIEEEKTPVMIEHKEDLSDKSMEDWAADLSVKVKERKTTVEFMPLMVYDYLVKVGKINATKDEKKEYLVKAVAYRHSSLIDAAASSDRAATEVLKEFNRMKTAGVFEGDEIERLKGLAKRMILYDHLKSISKQ